MRGAMYMSAVPAGVKRECQIFCSWGYRCSELPGVGVGIRTQILFKSSMYSYPLNRLCSTSCCILNDKDIACFIFKTVYPMHMVCMGSCHMRGFPCSLLYSSIHVV